MRKTFFLLVFALSSTVAFNQTSVPQYYLKLSGGKVSFGTGDVLGFWVGVEASKSLLKKPVTAVNKLLLGAEVSFENGVRTAQTYNPSVEDFYFQRFYQVSNTSLNPKLSYYPFGGFAKGFHIAAGPVLTYSIQSKEVQATRVGNTNGSFRSSVLAYDEGLLAGYRLGAGFEVHLGRKVLAGLRADFSNYANGDINTSAGLKVGLGL